MATNNTAGGPLPGQAGWVSSTGISISASDLNDPLNWNASQWATSAPFKDGATLTAADLNRKTLTVQCSEWSATIKDQPGLIRRLIWKWALGVTWKDLRPERDLETLRGLK